VSESVQIIYSDKSVLLDHLDSRLRASLAPPIEIALAPAAVRQAPETEAGKRFALEHPGWFPRYDPGQVVVEDQAANARIYIQGRTNLEGDEARFMASYSMSPQRIALLKRTLLVLLSEEGTWLSAVVGDTTMMVYGPDWVRQAEEYPNWYWGYAPSRKPDLPFVDHRNEELRKRMVDAKHRGTGRA